MVKSSEDSSSKSTIETEDSDELGNTGFMFINEEENVGRTKDFLILIDKRRGDPFSCSSVYKKDHEIMNKAKSWGTSGSRSNEEDLITKDFLKLIDVIPNIVKEDQEILKIGESGENSNAVSYEEGVRTKDYLQLIDRRRNEGEDRESMKMAKSGENLGNESEENDARTIDYLKLIDRRLKGVNRNNAAQARHPG